MSFFYTRISEITYLRNFNKMNIPESKISNLSPVVRETFLKWDDFLYNRVTFNRPESSIHAEGHCERVLL